MSSCRAAPGWSTSGTLYACTLGTSDPQEISALDGRGTFVNGGAVEVDQDADLTIGVPLSGGAGGTLKVHGALTLAGGGTQAGPVRARSRRGALGCRGTAS